MLLTAKSILAVSSPDQFKSTGDLRSQSTGE
jgi:hypothetical protein